MGLCFSDAATKAIMDKSHKVDHDMDMRKREAERRIKLLLLGERALPGTKGRCNQAFPCTGASSPPPAPRAQEAGQYYPVCDFAVVLRLRRRLPSRGLQAK